MAAHSTSKRRDMDLMKLMMSDFQVHIPDESRLHEFWVVLHGPAETPYHGGQWKVHVALPPDYPFKSPSIGFTNRLFHPNVDEM
ncbi:ubiquitin-conjugating enzyme e2 [Nannochloropsis oceanica]